MRHLKLYIVITILTLMAPMRSGSQVLPLLKNYTPENYHAHNVNYDIYVDKNGIVYVANFEGLLYYDRANWHIIHTPGITRITSLYCDKKDQIWAGGYNFLGYLKTDNTNGKAYQVNGNTVKEISANQLKYQEHSDSQKLTFNDGLRVEVIESNGLRIIDKDNKTVCHFTEDKGLCDNTINKISYDGHGTLWGATNKGIFTIAIPSKYSHFTAADGLKGEITDIKELNSTIYVSTTNGVYRCEAYNLNLVEGIGNGCSQLYQTGNSLLVATGLGVYNIPANGPATKLSNQSAISVMGTPDKFY